MFGRPVHAVYWHTRPYIGRAVVLACTVVGHGPGTARRSDEGWRTVLLSVLRMPS